MKNKNVEQLILHKEYYNYEKKRQNELDSINKLKQDIIDIDEEVKILKSKIKNINDEYTSKYYLKLKEKENIIKKIEDINKNYDNIDFYIKNTKLLNTYFTNITQCSNNVVNKKDLLNEFMINTNPNYISTDKIDQSEDYCNKCEKYREYMYSETVLVCPHCGEEAYTICNYQLSYKDPPQENMHFIYQRLKHFKDHLARLQAKESTKIPRIVYDIILVEFSKENRTNLAELTISMVREYLSKYIEFKLNKYYENTHLIVFKLNGLPPLNIPKEVEDQFCNMFIMIEDTFRKICPEGRSNLITYLYILYKLSQMCDYTEYLKHFDLLKSNEKLQEQDEIWKKICAELNWKFYPTYKN